MDTEQKRRYVEMMEQTALDSVDKAARLLARAAARDATGTTREVNELEEYTKNFDAAMAHLRHVMTLRPAYLGQA